MPNGTVVDWCRSVCGNAIGTILVLGLAGKLLLDGMLELRIFSEIICRFMLPATPVWVLSLVLLLAHLASLTSYGIPYLYPFCSSSVNDDMDWEDSIFRLPLSEMKRRPIFTRPDVRRRKEEE